MNKTNENKKPKRSKEMTIRLNKHNIYNTPDEVVIKLPNPIYDDHDPTILDETRKKPFGHTHRISRLV